MLHHVHDIIEQWGTSWAICISPLSTSACGKISLTRLRPWFELHVSTSVWHTKYVHLNAVPSFQLNQFLEWSYKHSATSLWCCGSCFGHALKKQQVTRDWSLHPNTFSHRPLPFSGVDFVSYGKACMAPSLVTIAFMESQHSWKACLPSRIYSRAQV